ncbi:probable serine/threonine-protein kinase nek3 isoform X2 [Nilaparvata lugens]|nr:probable serine/threonine-protein kinase nek3 isoform X2 [Nilaparvata lugens]
MGRRQERRNVEREVDIMRTLQHPRLIQLYDAFEISNVMCVIQELIEGGELFERVIDDDFILTEKACTVFVRQICEAVEFIHSQHILHLDLKPENILCLTRTGNRIKIIDFGLARKIEPDKKLQVLFGTPEFVAPEVVNFDQIGFGTDMWSVGVICYVLLSGLSPFMGETDVETMANVTIAQYDFDDDAFDDISQDAKDFISKLLMKNREQRMSASDCLLHSWLRRKPPPLHNQPPSPPATRRISGGLDSAKENLREFVDRWSQQPSSPQMIEFINATRKDSLSRQISADKMKILNEENQRNSVDNKLNNIDNKCNNVDNNTVPLINSANKQDGLTTRNASVDNNRNTTTQQQQQHPIKPQQNIAGLDKTSDKLIAVGKPQQNTVGLVTAVNIKPNEGVKSIGDKNPNKPGTVVDRVEGTNLIGNVETRPADVSPNLKLDIEAAKKAPPTKTPNSVTSPVNSDSSGTAKVSTPSVVKSGTIPKTPSGGSLKFDATSSPKNSVTESSQHPLSTVLKKDGTTDKITCVVSGSESSFPAQMKLGAEESFVKPSENVGKPSVIAQTQSPSSQTVLQSPKVESPGIKQQVSLPQVPAAASPSPVLEKPTLGIQAPPNQQKPLSLTAVTQVSVQSKQVAENSPQLKPSSTSISTSQPKPQTQSTVQSKFGNLSSSGIRPAIEVQSPISSKPIPSQSKSVSSNITQSTSVPPTMTQSTFGNSPSTKTKQTPGIQAQSQPLSISTPKLSHGAVQSKFGNLSSSDLKTSSKPLEQSSDLPLSRQSVSSTPNKPGTSGSASQGHPTFFLSTTDDVVDMEDHEMDSVPNELKNVVHEMRHISVHKPKMTSQLSEPDLTKCTLQRNIPDKKPSNRGVEQDPPKSNIFKRDSIDSRMNKPSMKHVPPKIHGIVLGQSQTDEEKLGPKVIMHKIHVEGRSEPLIPTSKENTSKPQQKPITKSQTLSKLELNESVDKSKGPSMCNLIAKDRFDMRRGSDISCFLHNTENMESPSLSEEIKRLSSRLFQKGQDEDLGSSLPRLIGHSAFKNDPIGRFMANHGVITKRPKYRLSNLNRDVPLGSPPPSSNIFYHLSHSDSFSDPHTTHSAPQSPTESPEREMAARHSGLTRDVILGLFGNKKSENDDMSSASTIDSLASYFNRANSKNMSSFFNNK